MFFSTGFTIYRACFLERRYPLYFRFDMKYMLRPDMHPLGPFSLIFIVKVRSVFCVYPRLRARRALMLLNDVPLRTRRALLPYSLYNDSALLVLNGTSLNSINALLALNWRYYMYVQLLVLLVHTDYCYTRNSHIIWVELNFRKLVCFNLIISLKSVLVL